MKANGFGLYLVAGVFLGAVFAFSETGCLAQTIYRPTIEQRASLEQFLREYLGRPYPPFEKETPTRYSAAFVGLKGDGTKEAIVYITGRAWCGSGGCTTLVLAPHQGSSFVVVARLTITRTPIRVLTRKSRGWHDIGVWMEGGGIQPGYEADLYFDGKSYFMRDRPTLRPSKRLQKRVLPGKTVIPSTAFEEGKRLYP